MEKKDLKLIQNALMSAEDTIRIICGGLEPYDLDDEEISDTFYKMNHCWLHIQQLVEKEGD